MKKDLKVALDSLRQGHPVKIHGVFDPVILGVEEPELRFTNPISLQGEVFLSEGLVIVHLSATTKAEMPCSICNEMTFFEISAPHFREVAPEEGLPESIDFDIAPYLREALLLEIPKSVECNGGACPKRAELLPYLSSRRSSVQFPFKNIK